MFTKIKEELAKIKEVKKMKGAGVIRHSKSPWASNVVMVMKKDGTWRFCCDWRRLNQLIKKDPFPLPRIDDSLEDWGRPNDSPRATSVQPSGTYRAKNQTANTQHSTLLWAHGIHTHGFRSVQQLRCSNVPCNRH